MNNTVISIIFIVLFTVLPMGAAAFQVQLPSNSVSEPVGEPNELINDFYQFALAISGLLAFGAIVWGGIKYTASAGSPSGQTEGRQWIEGALWGLLLLASAYLILNTINPEIVSLRLEGVEGGSTNTRPLGY